MAIPMSVTNRSLIVLKRLLSNMNRKATAIRNSAVSKKVALPMRMPANKTLPF